MQEYLALVLLIFVVAKFLSKRTSSIMDCFLPSAKIDHLSFSRLKAILAHAISKWLPKGISMHACTHVYIYKYKYILLCMYVFFKYVRMYSYNYVQSFMYACVFMAECIYAS